MIRAHNTARKWQAVKDHVEEGMLSIHESEKLWNYTYTEQLESKLKTASGRKYALTCASGSHAISIGLLANGIVPGDKIIIPNYSCPATLSSVVVIGCVPVFCEIDQHGMIDTDLLPELDVSGVKAVLATGLYGDVHNHDAIKNFCDANHLLYVNDAAQSQFALFNGEDSLALGDVVCMSFADNKPLPVAGTYGAILTDSNEAYQRIRSLRKNGKPTRLEPYSVAGFSSQPEEGKALQVLASWQHFDKWQERKRQISEYYIEIFKDKINVRPSPRYSQTNYHKFAIMVDDKFESYKKMLELGVETEQHYVDNFSKLPWTADTTKQYAMTDRFIQQSLTIPNNPFMTDSEVETVSNLIINNLVAPLTK